MPKANGDADPLSRIQPETKQMFHDAIKAVCSACVISASNPCLINSRYKSTDYYPF
jgi:hypothetical protein